MTTREHERIERTERVDRTATPFSLAELNEALRVAARAVLLKHRNIAKAAEVIATSGLTIALRNDPFTIRVRDFDKTLRELADELGIS